MPRLFSLTGPRRLLPLAPAGAPATWATSPPPAFPRVLSRAESEALFHRIVGMTTGGGDTTVTIRSDWRLWLRWGRNRPRSVGKTTQQRLVVTRTRQGAEAETELSRADDATLRTTVQTLEQQLTGRAAAADGGLAPLGPQQYLTPTIWSEPTFQMTPHALSEAVQASVAPVVAATYLAAGFAELSATSWAIFNTRGLAAYASATGALYQQTVRSGDGLAAGADGLTHMEWSKLDLPALSATALRHCRDSLHPRALEPGRYTAIFLPRPVESLISYVVQAMDRFEAETGLTIFTLTPGTGRHLGKSKIGTQMFDRRLTITSDPTDPECGYIPFDPEGNPYRPVTWVENGVLKALPYDRGYAHRYLQSDTALPNPMAYRLSGGETSLEEMIATTERGVLVAGIYAIQQGWPYMQNPDLTLVGYTFNGLWLVEHGKITSPIKNFWFRVSPLEIFNQVLQIGPTGRVYGTGWHMWSSYLDNLPAEALSEGSVPTMTPPLKIADFNFTRLTDAV